MVLDDIRGRRSRAHSEVIDKSRLERIASGIFPRLPDDRNGSRYRREVLYRFVDMRFDEQKRSDEGEYYRTAAQSRLDRAFTRTAVGNDRSEATIRTLCVHDIYDGEDQTDQFLIDILKIEAQYRS